MNMKKIIIACTTLLTVQAVSHAQQTETKVAEARIERQLQRLRKGMADQTINPAECSRLTAQLNAQKTRLNQMKADGKITTEERSEINRMQDIVSERMFAQKTDAKDANKKRKDPTRQ
jgi:nitrogen-specific signal transduction histidine kinase